MSIARQQIHGIVVAGIDQALRALAVRLDPLTLEPCAVRDEDDDNSDHRAAVREGNGVVAGGPPS